MDWMPQAIREGIFTIVFISGPLVILAATLGLSVGIIQAATQIQEQTLASAVKIIGLFLALIVFGFYMFQYLKQYAVENVGRAFRLVPSLGTYVKPRKNFLSQHEKDSMDQRSGVNIPGLETKTSSPGTSSKVSGGLNEPDLRNINIGEQAKDILGQPAGQIKKDNENLQRIEPGFSSVGEAASSVRRQVVNPIPAEPAQNSTLNSSQQNASTSRAASNLNTEPVVRPAARRPATQTSPARKPAEKKSLTDALSRIRSSIDEFNESNTQGVQ